MGAWTETIDAGSPQNEQDLQPLQPFDLQPDLWCSQVLRKQGFLTLQRGALAGDCPGLRHTDRGCDTPLACAS